MIVRSRITHFLGSAREYITTQTNGWFFLLCYTEQRSPRWNGCDGTVNVLVGPNENIFLLVRKGKLVFSGGMQPK